MIQTCASDEALEYIEPKYTKIEADILLTAHLFHYHWELAKYLPTSHVKPQNKASLFQAIKLSSILAQNVLYH